MCPTRVYVLASALTAGVMLGQTTAPEEIKIGRVNAEFTSGFTNGMASSRAIVMVPGATADSGQKNVLPTLGGNFNVWLTRWLGAFVDASYVDGMKATARVGNIQSEIQSQLMDLHGGVQVQYPGSRFRPYFQFGGGPARLSQKGSFTVGSQEVRLDGAMTTNSLTFGGGIRYFFSPHWGVRLGYDAVSLGAPGGGQRSNYGRMAFGCLWQSQ